MNMLAVHRMRMTARRALMHTRVSCAAVRTRAQETKCASRPGAPQNIFHFDNLRPCVQQDARDAWRCARCCCACPGTCRRRIGASPTYPKAYIHALVHVRTDKCEYCYRRILSWHRAAARVARRRIANASKKMMTVVCWVIQSLESPRSGTTADTRFHITHDLLHHCSCVPTLAGLTAGHRCLLAMSRTALAEGGTCHEHPSASSQREGGCAAQQNQLEHSWKLLETALRSLLRFFLTAELHRTGSL
jgi:hypothetical protein